MKSNIVNNSKEVLIKSIIGVFLILILTGLDQWSKILAETKLKDGPFVIINRVFEFFYLENRGAAWGILSGQRVLFIIITIVIMGITAYFYLRTPRIRKYMPLITCEILLISGALGNMIDRASLGYVRDFIYFKLIDFPVFNVADIYVVVSAFLLCFLVIFVYKDEDLDSIWKR